MVRDDITFVTASHCGRTLEENLLRSPILEHYRLVVMKDYTNVMKAYNEAKVETPLAVYVHHDVILPATFENEFLRSLLFLSLIDPAWGVAGVVGVNNYGCGPFLVGHVEDRGSELGNRSRYPREAETLDELILVTKGDFAFDELIPGNHFYGADLCLQARRKGRKSYAIEAYCSHNSSLRREDPLPADFQSAADYIKRKYSELLPFSTTCANIY